MASSETEQNMSDSPSIILLLRYIVGIATECLESSCSAACFIFQLELLERSIDDNSPLRLFKALNLCKNLPLERSRPNNSPDLVKFTSRLQEQTFHLQVLTCDNLPTQAKPRGSSMIPTYHCFKTLFATHGLIIYTYTELMSALWFDGRLLEQEDPSPTVDCNNSPDLGRITRYVDDSDLPMLRNMLNNL
eukprot:scaffold2862_cov55-Cylindrotheca_fusiformis.AAC.1